MSIEDRLAQAGIELPEPIAPVATYVPFVAVGNTTYISGQLCTDAHGGIKGTVGVEVSLDYARFAARLCGINLIAQMRAACGGDWNRLKRIVKLGGFVQAGEQFYEIPAVMNGCSDLMVDIFGERGKHARSAVGVYRLPFGYAVEVDAVVQIA